MSETEAMIQQLDQEDAELKKLIAAAQSLLKITDADVERALHAYRHSLLSANEAGTDTHTIHYGPIVNQAMRAALEAFVAGLT